MRVRRARITACAGFVAAVTACFLGVGTRGSSAARPTLFDYDPSAPLDLVLGKTTAVQTL